MTDICGLGPILTISQQVGVRQQQATHVHRGSACTSLIGLFTLAECWTFSIPMGSLQKGAMTSSLSIGSTLYDTLLLGLWWDFNVGHKLVLVLKKVCNLAPIKEQPKWLKKN